MSACSKFDHITIAVMVREAKESTHIIEDWKDGGDDGTWFRTLEKADGMALVHYWYTPDSADTWMPNSHNYVDPEVRHMKQC